MESLSQEDRPESPGQRTRPAPGSQGLRAPGQTRQAVPTPRLPLHKESPTHSPRCAPGLRKPLPGLRPVSACGRATYTPGLRVHKRATAAYVVAGRTRQQTGDGQCLRANGHVGKQDNSVLDQRPRMAQLNTDRTGRTHHARPVPGGTLGLPTSGLCPAASSARPDTGPGLREEVLLGRDPWPGWAGLRSR